MIRCGDLPLSKRQRETQNLLIPLTSNSSLGIFGVLLTFPPRPDVSFRSFVSRASFSAIALPLVAGFGVVVRGGNISLA